jgi:hypothetical protein
LSSASMSRSGTGTGEGEWIVRVWILAFQVLGE